ncbi:flexible cuticle protein 12-like [Bradysia coprophila]|uniref:flexible cuticle protein 12-like n=1 Tax=Bradysia coprophila TaxID=38358 RepID=UPI00187DBDE1|nr:flexible cuticle protein 12-like [Bradysia coprophila]
MFKLVVVLSALFGAIYSQTSDTDANVVNFESNNNPDGTYQYSYETSNGIYARASGVGGESEEGEVRYVAADGTPINYKYTVDDGGFKPVGNHIPQEPAHIARLIEWLESHGSESSDDGSYRSVGDDGSYRE